MQHAVWRRAGVPLMGKRAIRNSKPNLLKAKKSDCLGQKECLEKPVVSNRLRALERVTVLTIAKVLAGKLR